MKPNQLHIAQFSSHLFWDAKKSDIDFENNKEYIIKQVLEYGLISDWKLIVSYYGLKNIGIIACTLRELDNKTLSFISLLSEIPKEEFRCYTYQQSTPPHWNF
ncbi:MAG: hypothetical protein HQ521_22200 [Bacteroidetes bacterium]|nr:hypothetical protein [Bacteroidota bacterium]